MKFREFAKYLNRLDDTTKRLEMTSILSELVRDLDISEIDLALYLASGYLFAPYKNVKFNIADKMMIRMLVETYGIDEKKVLDLYKELGDLGSVAYELCKTKDTDLSITTVHERLVEIAKVEGEGSQELKVKKVSRLLGKLDNVSCKYVVRIILGNTRLGFTELTIIDALCLFLGDKGLKKKIEYKYNTHPDIGKIAKLVKEKGIKGLDKITLEPGTPVLLQKAQRVKSFKEVLERMESTWLEFKLDGTRVQLHMDKNVEVESGIKSLFEEKSRDYLVETYTRNLENTTHMYPDIVEGAKKQITAKSVILDGEALGYDLKTGKYLPFQEMMQRKRKHDVEKMAKEIPLKYVVFDILYLDGKPLVDESIGERKDILERIIKKGDVLEVNEHVLTKSLEKLNEYFEVARKKGLEGLIAKNPTDAYQAGARSYSWIKLKVADEKLLDDSVDCVALGYYYGKGTRAKFGIGGLLLGIYDEKNETYKTVSKLGTGLTESGLEEIKGMCDKKKVGKKPKNVDIDKMFEPDVYVEPSIVLEIGADEVTKSPSHSAGYALRFPRLLNIRNDKKADQCTSLKEIVEMYTRQKG